MIAIVDYGIGNLRSVQKALQKLGHAAEITSDPAVIQAAEQMILPGVGAFGAALENLQGPGQDGETLAGAVRGAINSGKPFLGICLGMQLLLTGSDEQGSHAGFDRVPGRVVRFEPGEDASIKIPHMGWNELCFSQRHPVFAGLDDGVRMYFVHSYYCRPDDASAVVATCAHGIEFCAALASENIVAVQFHPEKSGEAGLRILDNFACWQVG